MRVTSARPCLSIMLLLAVVATTGVALAAAEENLLDPGVEGVSHPIVIADTQRVPSYPPAALAARMEGSVVLAAIVNADGSVGEVKVLDSDHPRLGFEQAATHAIKQWKFEPARKGSAAVASYTLLRLNFRTPGSRLNPEPYVSGGFFDPSRLTGENGLRRSLGAAQSGSSPQAFGENNRQDLRRMELPPRSGLYDKRLLNQIVRNVDLPRNGGDSR